MTQRLATDAELELARKIHVNDEVNIDDHHVPIAEAEDGIWVQAWVFVSHESLATSTFGALN